MDKRGDRRPDRRRQGHGLGTLGDARQQDRERYRRDRIQVKPQKTGGDDRKRCPHCGGQQRARGAVGRAGHLRWKCRKCGRTVWVRPAFKPPVPIVPVRRNIGQMGFGAISSAPTRTAARRL
jgi:ribosomal protein L37AE/L43A